MKEKRNQPFNGLTDAEAERLALLAEELAEAGQAIGKILRHGYSSRNPCDPNHISNRRDLEKELAHVEVAVRIMGDAGDLHRERMHDAYRNKRLNVGNYLHHQDLKALCIEPIRYLGEGGSYR